MKNAQSKTESGAWQRIILDRLRGIILVDKQMNGKRRKEDPYKECWI